VGERGGDTGGAPWKPAASASVGTAIGGASAFGITRADSEQVAWGIALWSLMSLAGVIVYLARIWVERRIVHVDELAALQARIERVERKNEQLEQELRDTLRLAREGTELAVRAVKREVPS
jgi:hypothetical protein